jgi:predicted  nucleic acid-binding Zn-ribbon protein
MEIDFNDITPLDLRILNHLRKNSITDEWEPLYDYLVNNFNTDPEDTQKIILIYSNKENKNIDFKDVNDISIPNFDYSSYDTNRLAFAEFIDVDPVFVKPFETYLSNLTSFKVLIPSIGYSIRYVYYVGDIDAVHKEADMKIREKIDEEGWDFFSNSFLIDYVEINQEYLDYNVTEIAKNEYEYGISKFKSKIDVELKENLLKNIDKYDEYEDLKYTFDELTETKKEIDKTFLGLDNNINKLEKEKKIIEIEIERLGDITDYGDDEDSYSTEFDDELEDLENKLNKIENRLEEAEYEYNQYYKDYDSLVDELEVVTEKLTKYEGVNFEKLYMTIRKEKLKENYSYDIENYVDELSLTIGEAITDNVLKIGDEDYLIDEAIKRDGPEYFIGDLTKDVFIYNGEEYYILW